MTAIILAGGKGERLRSVIANIPKPLVPVAGKPFLHWLIGWVESQGETHVVLAARHLSEHIEDWVAAEQPTRPSCRLNVLVEPYPLDTGGAAAYAARQFKAASYLVTNGDSITFVCLKNARDILDADPELDGVIVSVAVDETARFGSLDVSDNGLLRGFFEKKPGVGLINAGIYLIRAELLLDVSIERVSIERDLFPRWLANGARFRVAVSHEPFIDIGTPDTFAVATEFIECHRDYFDGRTKLPAAELLGA